MCINKLSQKRQLFWSHMDFEGWQVTIKKRSRMKEEAKRERYLMKINLRMILRTPTRINNSKNNTRVQNRRGTHQIISAYIFIYFPLRWRFLWNLSYLLTNYTYTMLQIVCILYLILKLIFQNNILCYQARVLNHEN